MKFFLTITAILMLLAQPAAADKQRYLDLAKRGWSYELRTTMLGRDMAIPVHINGRDFAGASLCIVGEKPHAASLIVINQFRELLRHTYGKAVMMRYAGGDANQCGTGRSVILRLYSGYPPHTALTADLAWLNEVHQLGLPRRGYFAASSPAMGQTFFGHRGQGTHIMVKQPALARPGRLERAFYKSILIEELFQSFTFGMDILLFDRAAEFDSKLQETPLNLQRLPWESRAFMRALVNSNPGGLCLFDLLMMHAVGLTTVDQTIDPAFIEFIDETYPALIARAEDTAADPRFAELLSQGCKRIAL